METWLKNGVNSDSALTESIENMKQIHKFSTYYFYNFLVEPAAALHKLCSEKENTNLVNLIHAQLKINVRY